MRARGASGLVRYGPASVPSCTVNAEPPAGGKAAPKRIPEATVLRLPVYQRILAELERSGASTVSSEQLAALARVNAAKVRKDLSFLGSLGTRARATSPDSSPHRSIVSWASTPTGRWPSSASEIWAGP